MADLKRWQPEDEQFWSQTGKAIATRNLWISIPSLLCGFAVWMLWSILTVRLDLMWLMAQKLKTIGSISQHSTAQKIIQHDPCKTLSM